MNLKKPKEQEIEFYKKIGLYCGVEFNRTQKICKYLSVILAFVYFLIFAVYIFYLVNHTIIQILIGMGFGLYVLKRDSLKIGLLMLYFAFGSVCLLGVLFFQGIFVVDSFPLSLQELLVILAENDEDNLSSYQMGLLMTWSFALPFFFTLLAVLSVFMRRFESKLPALFLLYLLLLPFTFCMAYWLYILWAFIISL